MSPVKKKRKIEHKQKFLNEYKQLFPCFSNSKRGDSFAWCSICAVDISVAHGGKGDLSKHVKSNKHLELAKISQTHRQLTNTFTPMNDLSVIKAEVTFTNFLVRK